MHKATVLEIHLCNLIQPPGAWSQNSSVGVKIYEKQGNLQTSNAEFNAINSAIQDWNTIKVTGCSGVAFANATRANAVWVQDDYNYQFISKEVLVVRTASNTEDGRFQEIQGTNGIKGGYVILHSNFTHDSIPQGKGPLYRVDNLAKHEVGHSFGTENGQNPAILSAMGQNSFDSSNTLQITACDVDAHRRLYCPPTPTPTPYPTPDFPNGCDAPYENFEQGQCPLGFTADGTGYYCCENQENDCGPEDAGFCEFLWQSRCNCIASFGYGAWNDSTCHCEESTPIVIDTNGNGFSLTDAANGVNFDLNSDGARERLSWTSGGSDDAWLVLDRNGNNSIDDGTELFGNFTAQPQPPVGEVRNGFLALAVFDQPGNGGNGDAQIDRRDSVFSRLRLWRDSNHNGVSDSNETRKLSVTPIRVLELDYRESRRVDENGNAFRYRAIVRDEFGAQFGRWAWDVFLVRQSQLEQSRKIRIDTPFDSKLSVFKNNESGCRNKLNI